MSDNETNVIVLKPRAREAPALRFVEIRMDDPTNNCNLEMSVLDAEGNVVATLAYDLVYCTPIDFDLELLREAWARWRGGSTKAS